MTDEDTPGLPGAEPSLEEEARQRVAIAAGILAAVAKNTALEVEGVTGLAATLPERFKRIFGVGFAGVAVEFVDEDSVRIDLHLEVRYGVPLPGIGAEVRRKVAEKVTAVSGLKVSEVMVHIDKLADDGT